MILTDREVLDWRFIGGPLAMKGNHPWLRRADWKAGVICETHGMPSRGAYIVLVAGLFVLAAAWFVFAEEHEFRIGIVILGLAGIAQIGYRIVRARWRRARYGEATFEFRKVPFILGQKLRGTLKAHFPSPPDDYTRAILRCSRVYDDPNSTSDPSGPIFETRKQWIPMHLVWVGDEVHLPFELELPKDGFPTGLTVQWVLSLTCNLPREEFRAEFEIPVYGSDAAPFVQDTDLGSHLPPVERRE